MSAQLIATIEALRMEANEPNQVNLKDCLDREHAGDAELFAYLFHDRVAYDHAAKKWYIWRGNFWEKDPNGELTRLIINRLAPEYIQAGADALRVGDKDLSEKFTQRGKALLKARRIKEVLDLARNMEGIAITGNEWDKCPMVLGVSNGMIDLTTGTHRSAAPCEYVRKFAPVDWMGLNAPAPAWEQYILEVFDGEIELVDFMRRWLGYCITGMVTERKLPVLYGDGSNGKTVLLEALRMALGDDLSHVTQADALMDTKRDGAGAQPFVYALRGRRLVWATESREGQRINEGLVKQLTGGDSITTRTLFSDVVTFRPTHKVMLLTNHKPHISAESQSIWDRVLLIPFVNRFVDDPKAKGEFKRDPRLLETLQAEAAGILAWLVRGCLEWQRDGLNPPALVIEATEDYRTEEDTLGEFIADCLITGDDKQATARAIWEAYEQWTKENGLDGSKMNKITLGKKLARRFGDPKRTNRERLYSGVEVLMP
jgi:putative DNA primase/helicase